MGRLRRFLGLRADDGWLLVKAWVAVGLVRIGLWVLPYAKVRRVQSFMTRRPPPRLCRHRASAERVAWAVSVASRRFPGARHCLTEGITTQILLARRAYSARLCIGVAKEQPHGIAAHAWVESQGTILIGNTNLDRYTELAPGDERERSLSAEPPPSTP